MPELPEVETIKNELEPEVKGRRITGLDIFWPKLVQKPSVEEFRSGLIGRKIVGLSRRGKHLIFKLDNGKAFIIHFRMTGSMLIKSASDEPEARIRAVIHLDNDAALHFRDQRKFGKMWLVDNESEVTGELGPEPLEEDFTPRVLKQILGSRKLPIKVLLTDQTLIAGIGNMYADEALFRAKIHPLRTGNSLSAAEIKRLHAAIQQVLEKGIHKKGASVDTYLRPGGEMGTAHLEFQVAHRKGKPCPVCGTPIARITLGGRGTFFCPRCQPAP